MPTYTKLVRYIDSGAVNAHMVADLTDAIAECGLYADGSPVTERCPTSPKVNERPIVVLA